MQVCDEIRKIIREGRKPKRARYTIVRESGNLYYSRLRVSPNQLAAKTESVYLIREARHCGISLGLDTLKYTSIDADIRAVVDHFIFKSQGTKGFPDDMRWLYGYWSPTRVRWSKPQYFFIVSARGPLGIGKFPYPSWHKEEREDIVQSVGLKVEHGDEIDYGASRGAYKTVGDQEHLDIIESYFEGLGMGKIAKSARARSSIFFSLSLN